MMTPATALTSRSRSSIRWGDEGFLLGFVVGVLGGGVAHGVAASAALAGIVVIVAAAASLHGGGTALHVMVTRRTSGNGRWVGDAASRARRLTAPTHACSAGA